MAKAKRKPLSRTAAMAKYARRLRSDSKLTERLKATGASDSQIDAWIDGWSFLPIWWQDIQDGNSPKERKRRKDMAARLNRLAAEIRKDHVLRTVFILPPEERSPWNGLVRRDGKGCPYPTIADAMDASATEARDSTVLKIPRQENLERFSVRRVFSAFVWTKGLRKTGQARTQLACDVVGVMLGYSIRGNKYARDALMRDGRTVRRYVREK